jgi:hypothetical protein
MLGWQQVTLAALLLTIGPALAGHALALLKSSKSETQCRTDGEIWSADTCIELPAEVEGTWYLWAADLEGHDQERLLVRSYEEMPTSIRIEVGAGLAFIASENQMVSGDIAAALLWGFPDESGFMFFSAAKSIGHLVPGSEAASSPQLARLRPVLDDVGARNWLVIENDARDHYVLAAEPPPQSPQPARFRKRDPESSPCLGFFWQSPDNWQSPDKETLVKGIEGCLRAEMGTTFKDQGPLSITHLMV